MALPLKGKPLSKRFFPPQPAIPRANPNLKPPKCNKIHPVNYRVNLYLSDEIARRNTKLFLSLMGKTANVV